MKILGISAHYHDSAAALVVDGLPVASVQEERLSRRKNDAAFPLAAIEWCLEAGGLQPEDLDAVVFYERPMLKFDRILTTALRAWPRGRGAFNHAMRNALGEKVWVRGIIQAHLGVDRKKILFTEHHQSHAAAAFLTAPTNQAAILTTDGVGEWATLTVGRGQRTPGGPTTIELLREVRWPHSLGMLYSTFTAFLGFAVNEGEYKVMGLASYGTPRFADEVRKTIRRTADGAFSLDLGFFEFHTTAQRSYSQRFIETFGPPRASWDPIDLATETGRRYADIAASVQLVLEEILMRDVLEPFETRTGRAVPALKQPRPHITVDPGVLGGYPVLAGTRVPFDAVAAGYPLATTMHATSAADAIEQLTSYPLEVPPANLVGLDLVITIGVGYASNRLLRRVTRIEQLQHHNNGVKFNLLAEREPLRGDLHYQIGRFVGALASWHGCPDADAAAMLARRTRDVEVWIASGLGDVASLRPTIEAARSR